MCHRLDDEITDLFKHFICLFVKQDVLKDVTGRQLQSVDVNNKGHHLSWSAVFVGVVSDKILKAMDKKEVKVFRTLVKEAYVQKTFPLNNMLLRCLFAIDPVGQGHFITFLALKKLGHSFQLF